MIKYNKFYFVVRENEDGEWIDISTGSSLIEESLRVAKKDNLTIPIWAKNNPIKRVAEFELREV